MHPVVTSPREVKAAKATGSTEKCSFLFKHPDEDLGKGFPIEYFDFGAKWKLNACTARIGFDNVLAEHLIITVYQLSLKDRNEEENDTLKRKRASIVNDKVDDKRLQRNKFFFFWFEWFQSFVNAAEEMRRDEEDGQLNTIS